MNKSTQATMFSSASGEHETPQDLFDQLNKEFCFTLDPCATKENAKCERYFIKEDDGLSISWRRETVWINPPYGKGVEEWIRKAIIESHNPSPYPNALVVMLLPARTDTKWFSLIAEHATEVRFIKRRLRFVGHPSSAPFPSMLAIFRPTIVGPYEWNVWRIR